MIAGLACDSSIFSVLLHTHALISTLVPFLLIFFSLFFSRLEHLRDNWLFWNPSPAYYNILPLNSRGFLSVRGLLLQVIITWLWVTYAMDPAYREGTFLSCDGSSKRFLWFINVLLSSPFYVTFSCFFFSSLKLFFYFMPSLYLFLAACIPCISARYIKLFWEQGLDRNK